MYSVQKSFKQKASRKIESYFTELSNCSVHTSGGICLGFEFMGPCLFSPTRTENSIILGRVIYNFIKLFCDRTYFTQHA